MLPVTTRSSTLTPRAASIPIDSPIGPSTGIVISGSSGSRVANSSSPCSSVLSIGIANFSTSRSRSASAIARTTPCIPSASTQPSWAASSSPSATSFGVTVPESCRSPSSPNDHENVPCVPLKSSAAPRRAHATRTSPRRSASDGTWISPFAATSRPSGSRSSVPVSPEIDTTFAPSGAIGAAPGETWACRRVSPPWATSQSPEPDHCSTSAPPIDSAPAARATPSWVSASDVTPTLNRASSTRTPSPSRSSA